MKPIILVKIGGLPASDDGVLASLLREMARLEDSSWVLVHGGGKEVTSVGEMFGFKAVFQHGLRMTSPEEMRVVDMVLAGRVNTHLVRQALSVGLKPVGLGGQDGGTVSAEPLQSAEFPQTRTAAVAGVDPSLLILLVDAGYLPILHSTASDAQGNGLNVNADDMALAVAVAIKAERLVYISDVAGVKNGEAWLSEIHQAESERLIGEGVITGGMVPKIRSALEGVRLGIGGVIIGTYKSEGDLTALLEGRKGTVIR